ncbi:membrane protein [Burkholderia sp. MSh2]|nr:membrane protein [Burkholderia sp. MSh2]
MGVAVLLAACGGDDGGVANAGSSASNSNEAGTPTTTSPGGGQPLAQAACRPNGRFTYSGSASQVAANNGQLAVLVVPSLPTDYQKNRNITAPNAPASSQVQQASGAFTTLASSAAATDCLGLDHGAVTEIQSVGSDVAIGRWNQAMDTDGNTYTSEQGVHYAVGTPLSLSATSGTLACTQLIADTVAQNNSSVAGTLGASSATLDLGARTLTNLSLSINLGNSQYTLTNTQTPLNGVSTTGQLSVQTVVVGHDATQPLIAVGYSATLPNTNGVGGVVVLSCR